ncbi:MAG: hypothetical protein AAGU27_15060 [Dehalobacterium sp.]
MSLCFFEECGRAMGNSGGTVLLLDKKLMLMIFRGFLMVGIPALIAKIVVFSNMIHWQFSMDAFGLHECANFCSHL